MRVILAPSALADLEAIALTIAENNPARANTFVDELEQACLDIGTSPHAYPATHRYRNVELRRKPKGRYLIFYRVADNRIEIVRILHGARDYDRLLSGDEA